MLDWSGNLASGLENSEGKRKTGEGNGMKDCVEECSSHTYCKANESLPSERIRICRGGTMLQDNR